MGNSMGNFNLFPRNAGLYFAFVEICIALVAIIPIARRNTAKYMPLSMYALQQSSYWSAAQAHTESVSALMDLPQALCDEPVGTNTQ